MAKGKKVETRNIVYEQLTAAVLLAGNITLGKNEVLEKKPCPECGSRLVTDYGNGISCTFCIDKDCFYNSFQI